MNLDLFSIGSWTIFDHILRMSSFPKEGETITLDMDLARVAQLHYGDCSANVAAVAARLGLKVGLGMLVGDDFTSSGYRAHLEALGVDLAGIAEREGALSGHSFNFFTEEGGGFCLSHLGVAADQSGWVAPLESVARARAVLVNEMFGRAPLAAIEEGRRLGRLTAINGMVATAGPLAGRFLAAADVLFLSRSEAASLVAALGVRCGGELLKFGPRIVVVTQGAAGSIWFDATGEQRVDAVPAPGFVDSTGAGDSFVAGALCGLLNGLDIRRSGQLAATVASFVVEQWGCQTNLPGLEAVRARHARHFGEELDL
jgi:sugar/nucleoside kinase (ribokinase family)